MFLVRSEVEVRLVPPYNSHAIQTFSITAYLFLALYGSTTSQSRLFLKNIKNSLYNQKLVNNCSIPSMHAKRKITIRSHKHSFTLYPSLSPYSQTDRMTDGERIHLLRVGWRNFFPVVCVSFWFWREIGFGFTYLCTQSTIQLWCCVSFWFWREIVFGVTYVLSVQYSCAVVSVFWMWQKIVLNMRTCFYKIFLLGYFIMIRQPMCVFHKT